MFRWKCFAFISAIFVGSRLSAQTPARPIDPVFARAQALVSDGNGAAGRALIDSMIAATPPAAPLYPQALFWRASLAASAADAESDYKHIVVDYPLTPQAPDALLRLAQLELARGDREGALGHLQRIPRDYPHSKSLARANYWIARVFFEKNDLTNGCAANGSALAQLDSTEVELRNQIQYQGQRCPAAATASVVTQSQPAAVNTQAPAASAQAAPVTASVITPTVSAPTQPVPAAPVVHDSAVAKPVESAEKSEKPVLTTPVNRETEKSSPAKSEYSVQVAAYKSRADADKLVENLKARGYEARVDVSPDWFRVRIGRYPSEHAAEMQLREMKSKQMSGFVVRAPSR
jgi:cell division septation protein DedD